jgi:hypothetical protein
LFEEARALVQKGTQLGVSPAQTLARRVLYELESELLNRL